MAPMWKGSVRPWATWSPSALNIAVEKSMLSLTTRERAVLTTVTAIVSAALSR